MVMIYNFQKKIKIDPDTMTDQEKKKKVYELYYKKLWAINKIMKELNLSRKSVV